jgi:MFS family permease
MTQILMTFRNNFSPLRHPNFRTYIIGQLVSLIGTWLQATALGWVVWELTGSEAALGTVNLLNTLPILLLTPYAGVWADRLDRRKLLIATQIGMMAVAFFVALVVQTGMVQLWHIYVASIVLGVIATLDLPAQQAFLGDLSGMSEVRKAVNINGMVVQSSRVFGPALAGFIVANIGTATAFWLNGLSFLMVIVSLLLVRASQAQARDTDTSPLQQLRESLAFVHSQPRIMDMFAFTMLMFLFSWSIVSNLLPSVADTVLNGDAQTLGFLTAASGAGALASLLFVVPLAQAHHKPGWMQAIALLWASGWLLVFGVSQSLPLSMLALFLSFLGNPVVFTISVGVSQLMAPPNMRARVISLFTLASFGVQPIGGILVANFAEQWGAPTAIVVSAGLLLIGTATILVLRRGLREWEIKQKPPVTASEGVA